MGVTALSQTAAYSGPGPRAQTTVSETFTSAAVKLPGITLPKPPRLVKWRPAAESNPAGIEAALAACFLRPGLSLDESLGWFLVGLNLIIFFFIKTVFGCFFFNSG